IDIEVASDDGFPNVDLATKEITAITYYVDGIYHAFGCGDYVSSDESHHYTKCKDEISLIDAFLNVWTEDYSDVITGWSITQFDIPYLVNRIRVLCRDDSGDPARSLSPWGMIYEHDVEVLKKKRRFYDLAGIGILDYIDIYKKFPAPKGRESYALNYIAKLELEEGKLDYGEYGTLTDLYRSNYQKFIDYNIRDVELVFKLEKKLKLIELVLTLAYKSKVNYQDVYHQTKMWDSLIYNHLKNKNIIVPPKSQTLKGESYVGAYVKPTIVGKHKWVVNFDLTSLYPMLIQQYNISPETMVKPTDELYKKLIEHINDQKVSVETLVDKTPDLSFLKQYGVSMTPNKQFFKQVKQGFMPELMAKMCDERSYYRKEMLHAQKQLEVAREEGKHDIQHSIVQYNNFQSVIKICLNSLYGTVGNPGFRFFDVRIAEAVTLSAQLSIKFIVSRLNKILNKMAATEHADYVIASDTDSVYLNLEAIVEKMEGIDTTDTKKVIRLLDEFSKEILSPYIKKSFEELATYMNAYANKMSMKREALASVGIWTK
ncbi:MAG: DNA polymerase domain-containing protein, partial [Rhabdochlamydiaceae bacterium]